MTISARFADPDEAEALKQQRYQIYPHELGHVFMLRPPLKADETVRLGFSRFFRQITVKGIYST